MAAPSVNTDFDVKSISSSTSEENTHTLSTVTSLPIRKDTKEELPNTGMMCDVKNLWEGKQKCACCTNWIEEYPEDVKPNPEETEAVQRYALIVRNKKGHSGGKAMVVSSIVVQSPLLKPLLEEVFEDYEGITAGLQKLTFTKPFAPFFYRWGQFRKAVKGVQDEETRAHAQLLYNVLSGELNDTINTWQDQLSHGVITFSYLWTLFKPGDILLCRLNGQEMMMKLQKTEYESNSFVLYAKYVDWSGFSFGYASHTFNLHHFDGTKSITDLDAYPIQFNSEAAAIESRLSARGKRFEELQGLHYKLYKGFAELIPAVFGKRIVPARERTVDGRIIIHAEMYNRFNPSEACPLEPLDSTSFAPNLPVEIEQPHVTNPYMPPPPPPPPHYPPGMYRPKRLSEEYYPLCTPILKGYSLKTKNWAKFQVDNVHEIVWDDRAFDSLVLPPGYKDLILSFTKGQNSSEERFDDVIEGKGQGIVMLLNGEPGVGKTLTAESVAEHMRVPLYSMSAAQLGVDSTSVEQTLGDILEMTMKWKAILLLDETEVFLEQRTINGLERNKLVSIFLRMLEYYRGVLFLTTNRIAVLDKALDSRIHLKISYPELDRTARLQVWRNLIDLLPPSLVGLDSADLEYLAERKMNGREIKNVIKAAQLLASGADTSLCLEHVHTVLRITQIGEDLGIQV
ncbi:P-loop containing nucleoside triphosphate hydrolase protein [Lindgomyces ingoldianus]|uniref:P-loop containing nucleoside triphosphate hydrolase protein n=1 Tax=Lindgomyces ingoldianus TaxID=673940 RepID=A0ACB6QR09_9PLEO|nr:P-loop containing nucleoside triphosphate hydrolase protein [Lindgomyces ingoldianus]KAF2469434.1 P-loop containing nucleoside triphosphate hydrolase protein [Lindgomyces ingoldianus]